MIKNYIKIALWQLRKQKMYAAIKIGGFALSIAACLLIALYIKDELSYDKAYPDADRIYRVIATIPINGKLMRGNSLPAPVAKVLKLNFPEVEMAGRLMSSLLLPRAGSNELRRADNRQNTHEEGFNYADQEMLNILKMPMVYGDRAHALTEPNTLVISKKKADKYFPGQNPVGKVMYLNNDITKPYKIGGVMQDFPTTSHLQYDFLLTLKGIEFFPGEQTMWEANNYDVYVLLRSGTNIAEFQKKATSVILKNYIIPRMIAGGAKDDAVKTVEQFSFYMQPISDIHLESNDIHDGLLHGDIRFIWLFAAIAGFILIIACINFINLSTAKSASRAKEVGVRKVIGCTRFSLMKQFLTESLLFSLLSFAVGILLAWILLPYFNTITSKSLTIPWSAVWLIPTMITATVITGILAGLYPAFYLSTFKPVNVLKGVVSTGSKNPVLRNGLVVFQFTASIILIISTFVIYHQTQFILNKKLGFDKNQVVMLQGANILGNNVKNFKDELLKLSTVKSVTVSDYLPIAGTNRGENTFYNEGKAKVESGVNAQFWRIDNDYLKTMGIKLMAGRNFLPEMSTDSQAVVINQTLANKLNLRNPIGKRITNGGKIFQVIGMVEDFNFESLRDPIGGLCMHLGNSPSIVSVKVNAGNMENTISTITPVWKKFSPEEPIRYTFLDERFANMYADVQRMGRLFTSFAILSISIACLGLFALAAFMAEQRRKEIGIRKVLGAGVQSITKLLSVDFLKLVTIAIVIASPIAWLAMTKWLQDFAYRISISWWMFVLAGMLAILIALFTVSFQAIKAAISNPVKSLRSE